MSQPADTSLPVPFSPTSDPYGLPATRATGHAGSFYALQEVSTKAYLCRPLPDQSLAAILFPTLADAASARNGLYRSAFSEDLTPPPLCEVIRIVPMSQARALALRRREQAEREYRAASALQAELAYRRILREIESLPERPWENRALDAFDAAFDRAFDWLDRNLWPVLLILGALWALVSLGGQ